MQGIFRKENTDKALKYGIYRHLPTYEKIIRNLVSFYSRKIIPVRRYSSLDYFTKNELDFYTTESKVMLRAEAVKSIDFRFIKKKLIDELRFLLI